MRRCILILVMLILLSGCSAPHQVLPEAQSDVIAMPETTPAPTAAPTATPQPTAEPTEEPAAFEHLGCVYAVTAALYDRPAPDAQVLETLPQGQTLTLSPAENGYYAAKFGDQAGYVLQGDVQDLGVQREALNGLINVRLKDESFLCYMLFAQEENFCGHPLYDADVCMLEPETFRKLQEAQQRFMQDGYRIKLNDAYRPQRVQYMLFEEIPDRTYIASPERGSRHNRGLAVDMTLVDMSTGLEIEMPSPMHTFGGAGRRDYDGHSKEAQRNMDYMTDVMEDCGFTSIKSEWWHFMDLSNEESFPVLDIAQSEFVAEPAE